MSLAELASTLVGVGVLALVTVGVLRLTDAPHRLAPLAAIGRGVLQLAVLSLILSGVIRSPVLVAVALVVMFVVAVATAAGRLGRRREHLAVVAAAMGSGVLAVLVIVFATGAITFSGRYLLAIGGIVIGNTMTTATLAGRRTLESIDEQWEQVEGWIALGAVPRQATRALAQRAVWSALIPTVDQTRTTGLVTLPGAFVGAIFGGVSPLEAGRFQIVVLAAIIAAGSITAMVVVESVAPVRVRPAALR